ncbi:uncharacterized protein [Amphiura filiformis]|uniref:uncharacterized protein isoform X2 n=1 Tax=Amphiura filiformis TaxID=82378 RepID=UPI003B20F7D5
MAVRNRNFTIKDLVTDTSVELPMVVEVKDKYKEHSLKKGDLLWLTQLIEEDERNTTTTVEGSRWDAPDFPISFKMDAKITLCQKTYSSVNDKISFGPVMDISGLANLGEPQAQVFGIVAEVGESEGMLKIAEGAGRIVSHGKEHITGYLAKGVNNPLMIPGDYKGLFTKSQSLGTKSIGKRPIRLMDLDQLPTDVIYMYSAESTNKDRKGLKSLDEVTLLKESPITILALCRYTATRFSLHDDNSSHAPFHASWLFPDYCKLPVRPASSIPLYPWAIEDNPKPSQTVQILTTEQYQEMDDRLKQSPPPIPGHSTNSRSSTVFSSPDYEPIYEVPPQDARLPASAASSGGKVFDVPQRRSVKRNKRHERGGRRAVSDLGLDEMSRKEYVNIGIGPAKGARSDGYMKMNAGVPSSPNGAPVLPPRQQNILSPPDDQTRRPIPKPRSSDQNKASTLPSRRPLVRRSTDGQISQIFDDDLDYGQEYTLIPGDQGSKGANGNRSKDPWGARSTPDKKAAGQQGVRHYAKAYENTPSRGWTKDAVDKDGYLKVIRHESSK